MAGGVFQDLHKFPASTEGPDFSQDWPADYMGLSSDEIIRRRGLPSFCVMAEPYSPGLLSYEYGEPVEGGRTDAFIFGLEADVVIMSQYVRMGRGDSAAARAQVLDINARVMNGLNDHVWAGYDSDKDTAFWRLQRSIADTPYDVMLLGRVSPAAGYVTIILAFADSSRPGDASRHIYARILEIADNVYPGYEIHGDVGRLRTE